MSAPYKRMDFTAKSGNECRLKVFGLQDRRLVVDAAWEISPSDADMAECGAWVEACAKAAFPGVCVAPAHNVRIEDADARAAAIDAMTRPWGRA